MGAGFDIILNVSIYLPRGEKAKQDLQRLTPQDNS